MLGPVVARPRSFYITQKLDRWLDEAVGYLNGARAYTRPIAPCWLMRLLHDPALFTPAALDAAARAAAGPPDE